MKCCPEKLGYGNINSTNQTLSKKGVHYSILLFPKSHWTKCTNFQEPPRIAAKAETTLFPLNQGFYGQPKSRVTPSDIHAMLHRHVEQYSPSISPPQGPKTPLKPHPPTQKQKRSTHVHTRPSLCWTGNGNFFKCKSTGLKIQINVCHMWYSGRAGFWKAKRAVQRRTRTAAQTSPPLPWAFSTNTTLESCWKLCPSRSIFTPPRAEHDSRFCFSTNGSSWADLWAVGGRRKMSLIGKLMHTHSPCRPEHPDQGWFTTSGASDWLSFALFYSSGKHGDLTFRLNQTTEVDTFQGLEKYTNRKNNPDLRVF